MKELLKNILESIKTFPRAEFELRLYVLYYHVDFNGKQERGITYFYDYSLENAIHQLRMSDSKFKNVSATLYFSLTAEQIFNGFAEFIENQKNNIPT